MHSDYKKLRFLTSCTIQTAIREVEDAFIAQRRSNLNRETGAIP